MENPNESIFEEIEDGTYQKIIWSQELTVHFNRVQNAVTAALREAEVFERIFEEELAGIGAIRLDEAIQEYVEEWPVMALGREATISEIAEALDRKINCYHHQYEEFKKAQARKNRRTEITVTG